MSEAGGRYGVLSETSTIEETRNPALARHLSLFAPFGWLRDGWRDLWNRPASSLAYGAGVFLVSLALVWTMFVAGRDYILFPALAGFMVVGPLLAVGLYEKSRRIEAGEHATLGGMLLVKAKSGAQIFFIGAMLCMLMLLWMRAAVIVYALFFGVRPFPGFDNMVFILFTTPLGWAMLVTGTLVGGLFAAFAFAISVFSIPMLLDRRTDALTAMGTSMAMVWNNLKPMIAWGALVLALFAVSVATGLIGLVVIFPLLGHATWHAYRAVQ